MRLASRLAAIAALAIGLALAALPAQAGFATGSAAWLIKAETLHEGPGRAYDVVGQLPGETRIRVDRCTWRWCRIHAHGARGWVSRANVSFGQWPRGPFTGPKFHHPRGGTACFYEGRNYSGARVCARAGTVVRDLLLFDRDNRYSSVEVHGSTVLACRDRDFTSFCVLIVESQPRLDGFLDNNLSSYRVY
ncbi:SH3 domain-containing protein [Devosia sp.]|uniref:SH3 domain-containing protein n=1 Tax=Devosia sp. TaxID=1871048 RepID=UPI002EE0DDD7